MANPNDYISQLQQPDIAGSLIGGIQAGQQLQQSQIAQQQAQMQQQRHIQYSDDLQSYLQNPTAQGAAAMMAKYPESQKAMAASFDVYNKGQKEEIFKAGTQAYSAIQNGKPEIAMNILDERIKAAENSGQDTKDLESLKQSIQQNPKGAAAGLALTMSSLNPPAWSQIASEQRSAAKAPAEQSLAESKAASAATTAKFAESKAAQDLQKGGWEINKLQNDIGISRQNSQIAAMNAQTARLANDIKTKGNDIRLQELNLKLQDKLTARDQAVHQKAAEVTTARGSMDNFLNTADRVLQTDPDTIDKATGPFDQYTPTLRQDTADFQELIGTLGSQAFLAQIPNMKSMGSLSEKEGDKLQTSLQNLSLRQSPERLMQNVKEAQRLILKSRQNLSTKYGIPDVTPDTPAAAPSPTNIDELLKKYGGQ